MKRVLIFIFLSSFILMGCQKQVSAKFYMARAGEAFYNAHKLRTKKGSEEKRLEYYRNACSHFKQAHQLNPDLFTLYHIDSAIEACTRVDDSENKKIFQEFQDEYIREHPIEAEHGDAGVELLVAE